MALQTRIKISGVTTLHQGRYGAGMGVEMIGIPIDPQFSTYVSDDKFREMIGWLEGVKIVGELKNQATVDLEAYPVDLLQTESLDTLVDLQGLGKSLIWKTYIEDYNDRAEMDAAFSRLSTVVDYFLVESREPNKTPASFLAEIANNYPLLLGFGVKPNNVHKVLQEITPTGIALYGGEEIILGHNDFDELADILETLEVEG